MDKFIKKNRNIIRKTIEQFVDKETAKDIEQNVYVKLWKTSSYQKNIHYIKTIVINTCKDFFRSKSYKLSNINNADDDELTNVVDLKERPEEHTDNIFRQKQIKKAIDKLPPKLKQVVIMFEIEDISQEEISAKLCCPIGTIKSRLYNARKILYNELKFLIEEQE